MAFRLDDDLDELARNMYPPSMNSPHKLSGLDIGLSPFLPGEVSYCSHLLNFAKKLATTSSSPATRAPPRHHPVA